MLFFPGCEENESLPEPSDLVEIASIELADLDLELDIFNPSALEVGFNPLKISLKKRGDSDKYTQARVSVMPIMTMPNMVHSAPHQASLDSLSSEGYFQKDLVFIMPSGEMGSWILRVKVEDLGMGKSQEIEVPIEVKQPEESRLQSFLSERDSSSFFVSLIQPLSPEVGLNDFQVSIHRRENMMSFPAEENLVVEIEPEMPTMGHGSEGNINPIHSYSGIYSGKVSFNMVGFWRINVRIKNAQNETIGETSFELDF